MECLLDWTRRKAVTIEPYGLDMSEKLLTLAKPHGLTIIEVKFVVVPVALLAVSV